MYEDSASSDVEAKLRTANTAVVLPWSYYITDAVVEEKRGIGDEQVWRWSRTFMAVALGLVPNFKNELELHTVVVNGSTLSNCPGRK